MRDRDGRPFYPENGGERFCLSSGAAIRPESGGATPRPRPAYLGGEEVLFRDLSGVAAEVEASVGKTRFREAALFTHRGLSGPAILQVSSYWQHGEPVAINFFPDRPSGWLIEKKKAQPRTTMKSLLGEFLPDRLASTLADNLPGIAGSLHDNPDKALGKAGRQLANWQFHPNGSEGFAKAEVTAGGISTAELSSKTMEAKRIPGLFVVGEAVDVTGWLGGYNFQWAWASAFAAAQAL